MLPPSESSPHRSASLGAEPAQTPQSTADYNPEERKLLLQIAHQAVLSHIEGREVQLPPDLPEHLSEPRGVFTTLYLDGALRGCVGYPTSLLPLHRAVIETARAAAFDDPRFDPLTLSEAHKIQVSLSVLSPLRPISADQVQVGKHGLMITEGPRRGLLLPQVPGEHGWDRVTFLEQTCRKAGLAIDAWRTGAKIEAFTAEVFADQQ